MNRHLYDLLMRMIEQLATDEDQKQEWLLLLTCADISMEDDA